MTGDVDNDRVQRLLGGEGLAWLVRRARQQWERGGAPGSTLRLVDPSPQQREAIGRLLGRRLRATGALSVRIDEIEQVLLATGAAPNLRSAVEALGGPLVDRPGLQSVRESLWDSGYEPLDAAAARRPALAPWVAQLRASGLLRRLATDAEDARRLAESTVKVLDVLPCVVPELRARLAGRVLDDAHALDDGRPVATLVLRAAPYLGEIPSRTPDAAVGVAVGAAGRRQTWASVGVEVGTLTAPVLTVGLPGDQASATGRVLTQWREVGQPVHLSVRQLVLDPPVWSMRGAVVSVCENPSVVSAAADVLGSRCAPLVCTNGQPSTAVATLLDLVVGAGASLRYHGDFDWGGLRIATTVVDRWGALPWRFGAAAYRQAIAAGSLGRRLDPAKRGPSAWDQHLSRAMSQVGRAVEEEAVVDDLLSDLAAAAT